MLRRIAIGCLAMLLSGLSTPAQADLMQLYIEDTTVAVGGTGTLNVYLSGTSADVFSQYQVHLEINGPNLVEFAASQSYGYLNAPNYVFPGNSGDALNSQPGGYFLSAPPYNGPNDFVITDFSNDFNNYGPSSNTPPFSTSNPGTLLASLQINAVAANAGEVYSVSVITTPLDPGGVADSYFSNASGTNVDFTQDTSQTGYKGTITVLASSIPEPASSVPVVTVLVLLGGWQGVRWLRRSRVQPA